MKEMTTLLIAAVGASLAVGVLTLPVTLPTVSHGAPAEVRLTETSGFMFAALR